MRMVPAGAHSAFGGVWLGFWLELIQKLSKRKNKVFFAWENERGKGSEGRYKETEQGAKVMRKEDKIKPFMGW